MRKREAKLKTARLGCVAVTMLGTVVFGGATQALNASAGTSEVAVASDSDAAASVTGVIAGRVFIAGGPPRRGGHNSGRLKVVVMDESRKVVARTTTARNGEFSVRVIPGNYFIVSKLGTFTCQGKGVLVRAGARVRTSIVCSIK